MSHLMMKAEFLAGCDGAHGIEQLQALADRLDASIEANFNQCRWFAVAGSADDPICIDHGIKGTPKNCSLALAIAHRDGTKPFTAPASRDVSE